MNLADIHRPELEKLCNANKWQLEDCKMRTGMIYIRVRNLKIKKDRPGTATIEFECKPKEFNISRIKKRINQLLGKMPFDEKECVPETCGQFISELNRCKIIDKETGKESTIECSQLSYKGKP